MINTPDNMAIFLRVAVTLILLLYEIFIPKSSKIYLTY